MLAWKEKFLKHHQRVHGNCLPPVPDDQLISSPFGNRGGDLVGDTPASKLQSVQALGLQPGIHVDDVCVWEVNPCETVRVLIEDRAPVQPLLVTHRYRADVMVLRMF